MIQRLFESIFGTPSERTLKKYKPTLERINALDGEIRALADADFPVRTAKLKEGLAETLAALPETAMEEERKAARKSAVDVVLPEAFALVREAARRAIGLRHYDVQLLGGMVLHDGS